MKTTKPLSIWSRLWIRYDALRIVDGVNSYKNKKNAFLIITHYQDYDYIKPDFVMCSRMRIAKTGHFDLANELEKTGYKNFN